MPVRVVDASALAAMFFEEPDGLRVAGQLMGASLAAPAMLAFEMANVCLTKMRRHPGRRQDLEEGFRAFADMDIDVVEIDLHEALTLARRTKLSVYDATYLWLARALNVELVTLDKRLATAAAAEANND